MQMADIWSCGIILYAMLFGRYPFNARERDYARKIVSAQYVLPSDVPVSAECADLLTRVLVADPHVRLSMDDIKRHPWFNQDLPGGALQMNDFYLQAPPFLDMVRATALLWACRNGGSTDFVCRYDVPFPTPATFAC